MPRSKREIVIELGDVPDGTLAHLTDRVVEVAHAMTGAYAVVTLRVGGKTILTRGLVPSSERLWPKLPEGARRCLEREPGVRCARASGHSGSCVFVREELDAPPEQSLDSGRDRRS